MFWSRLDEAKQSVDADCVRIATSEKLSPSKASASASITQDDVIFKVSEYLFDLFDANCTDAYKRIDDFENRALKAFEDYENDEYTFEQENLHRQFLALFEELIEGFLRTENISMDDLYSRLSSHLATSDSKDPNEALSNEIADVISFYTSFNDWARHMKLQSKHASGRIQGFGDKIFEIKQEHMEELMMRSAPRKVEPEAMNESFDDGYYEVDSRSL
jgi:hypothetical protein